jgi:hypothetical protein
VIQHNRNSVFIPGFCAQLIESQDQQLSHGIVGHQIGYLSVYDFSGRQIFGSTGMIENFFYNSLAHIVLSPDYNLLSNGMIFKGLEHIIKILLRKVICFQCNIAKDAILAQT